MDQPSMMSLHVIIFYTLYSTKFNSIQFIFTIPNACTTTISQFMKYSNVGESPWYSIKIKYTGCQIYK